MNAVGLRMDTEALCHICEELHKQTAVTATPGKNLVTNIFNYICCEYRHLKGIKWTTDKTGIPLKMDMVETTFSAIVAKCGITEPKIAVNALLEKGEHFIIRDIFRLYLRGMGYDYIQKSLKQKGYQIANGNDFSKSAINSILKNQKYMGTYVYDRTESKDSEGRRNSHKEKAQYIQISNGMPAIISEKDFQKAQENMRKNATKQTHRTGKNYYALNGYLHCSSCGKAYSGNVNYSNGHKYLQYRKSCNCDGKSVRADHLNDFVFHALQQCIFSPENKEKLLHKIHEKLAIQRHIQSDEENRLMNQIHGLEMAQENLTAYLETGKGSDTILNKLQQNETTLKTLQQQLDGKKAEISTVDEDTYRRLVKQFKHYMSHVKSPEAAALKTAAIQDIEIQKEDITVKFCEGVPIDKETEAYFHLQ